MPASARLLQKLKETWGEEVTQDLVTWVNEAQTVNQAQLREQADSYFGRFRTLLDERIALSEIKFEAKLNERIGVSEARLEAKLDERINGVRLEIARLEGRMDAGMTGLRAEVASQMRDQMKWMFVFWIGTLVPLAGLIVALGKAWL